MYTAFFIRTRRPHEVAHSVEKVPTYSDAFSSSKHLLFLFSKFAKPNEWINTLKN